MDKVNMLGEKTDTKEQKSVRCSHREYDMDVLRILSMCGVISLHLLGGLVNLSRETISDGIVLFIRTAAFAAVNIFGMMSGYFGIYSKRTTMISRIIMTQFYCLIISIIWLLLKGYSSTQEILYSIFPFINGRLWYIYTYVAMSFFIP